MLRSAPVDGCVVRVTEVGWKARRLVDGVASVSVVAALSRSVYLDVAGEIVWLGPPGSTLHGRAIIAGVLPAFVAQTPIETGFDLSAAREWRPPVLAPSVALEIFRDAGRRLAGAIDRLGPSDGFGALLVGRRPAFPLDRAEDDARRFLAACASGDTTTVATTAERLLGLGPGLTPAGDDLIGGALFLTALMAWPASNRSLHPREAAALIRARAAERTHRISATLLGDLLDGDAYAPLHDLVGALARDDARAALDAAARLTHIGHSSGWDMLTGLLGALDALPPPP